jgi:VWFA-related protein
MPGRGWTAAIVPVALWLFSGPGGGCQAPAPPADQTPRLIPRTHNEREQRFLAQHRIILNVQVADSAGKPAGDLAQADFTLYDNDQQRKLVGFSSVKGDSAAAPPHVILVLDTVNNFSRPLHLWEREIETFLKKGEGPLAYPVSIGIFSGARIEVGQATRDREALLADLKASTRDLHPTGCIVARDQSETAKTPSFAGGSGGGFRADSTQMLICLNNRFISSVMAVRNLAQEQVDVPGRVILIWIGPGWPILTNHSFTPDTPEIKSSFFNQLVGLSTALREAQVTVDAVASPEDLPEPQAPTDVAFFNGISNEEQVRAGDLGLHALAHQTGGRIVTYPGELAGQIRDCISDAESYYVLTFDTPAATGFGEYHSLAVKIDKPGLEVRTNTLYYAEQ